MIVGIETRGGTIDEFGFGGAIYARLWGVGRRASRNCLCASASHCYFWFWAVMGRKFFYSAAEFGI